jgi:hypothetical protein
VSVPVVGVHGIRCYRYYDEAGTSQGAAALMGRSWTKALAEGAALASEAAEGQLAVAYYAHLLHEVTAQGPETDLKWLSEGEQAILMDLLHDLGAPPQVAQGPGTVPVRQAAQWLATRFGGAAVGSVAIFCREVQAYLGTPDSARRVAVRDAVADTIASQRPRAVVAHSLGSVVAYEALWHRPGLGIELFLTIGSPLGMARVVQDRLIPPLDQASRRGAKPPGVARWLNVADAGDLVAAPASLARTFDGVTQLADITIGPVAFHAATSYLSHPSVATQLVPYLHRA